MERVGKAGSTSRQEKRTEVGEDRKLEEDERGRGRDGEKEVIREG